MKVRRGSFAPWTLGAALGVVLVAGLFPAGALADSPCPARDGAGGTLGTSEFSNISHAPRLRGERIPVPAGSGSWHGLPVDG